MYRIQKKDNDKRHRVSRAVLSLLDGDPEAPVIMCVGSTGAAGDALGPIVGELLTGKFNIKAYVYGTVKRPLTALTLLDTYNFIKRFHGSVKVIVVDASLGSEEEKGSIIIKPEGIKPGAALNKELPLLGDYSITANVGAKADNNMAALLTAPKAVVCELAENIAFGISDALKLQGALAIC